MLPMPEPKAAHKPRVFVADHFSLDMIKEAGALEQGRITRNEATLLASLADHEVCSLIKNERMALLLSDLLQMKLEVDKREAKGFIGIGDSVLFVEELDRGVQFWRLDVNRRTRGVPARHRW
jgi:hypothetical protein